MEFSIQILADEHREIEAALDTLAAGVPSGAIDMDAFRRARELCVLHYRHEETFLAQLAAWNSGLAAKLRAQHDEALELAVRLEEAVNAGQDRDTLHLTRRFLAIAQHNIIEEERDIFPLAGD